MAKVSFIVPVYGVEKYLEQCLDSIQNQSLQDWECILIDDGSPDNSGAICDRFASADPRFKVIHKINEGVSAARNDGIELSVGEYIYFVDSDDWLELDAAERLYAQANQYRTDCVMSYAEKVYPDGSRVRTAPFSRAFFAETRDEIDEIAKYVLYQPISRYYTKETTNGYAAPWAKFIKGSIVRDSGVRFDPYLMGVFDDGLWSIQVLDYVNSLLYIHEKTYNYRIVESSLTNSFKDNAIDIQKNGYERIEKFLKDTHKDSSYWDAYYAHVVRFFGGYLSRYYYNQNNPNLKYADNYVRSDMQRWPYSSAALHVNIGKLVAKDRLLAYSIRHKSLFGLKTYVGLKNLFGQK
jgi:glycosyltransferase involved in cell wall biosynthesis